jgi:hypothetical protein
MFQYLNELIFSGVSKTASTPPRTNFEKLQDILQKRKGLKGLMLDVSSSGALAASLDKCLVCFCSSSGDWTDLSYHRRIPKNLPSTP